MKGVSERALEEEKRSKKKKKKGVSEDYRDLHEDCIGLCGNSIAGSGARGSSSGVTLLYDVLI